jgi:putative endonuclease
MADPRHRFGRDAEEAAAAWLERNGWTVLARRYRTPAGSEVDLVMLDPAGVLVGVEVRARRSGRAGIAAETVDTRRARRIGRSVAAFATGWARAHGGLRVDLVAVEPVDELGRQVRMRRVPNIGE